jgi:hypothetical protein
LGEHGPLTFSADLLGRSRRFETDLEDDVALVFAKQPVTEPFCFLLV